MRHTGVQGVWQDRQGPPVCRGYKRQIFPYLPLHRQQHSEREEFETQMDRFNKYLKRNEGRQISGTDALEAYFNLFFDDKKKVFLFAKEKVEVIERVLTLCGYFVIVTSEEMTAREALLLYKSRDDSEKLFRSDKSYLGNKSFRVGSEESASAKIFIDSILFSR